MTPHPSRLSALLLCLIMLFSLSSCERKPHVSEPNLFTVDSETIPSLNQILEGKEANFVSSELPSSQGGGSRGENPNTSPQGSPPVYRFVYEDFPNGGNSVKDYMLGLTDLNVGFLVINSEGNMDKPPDFNAERGTLYLSRKNLKTFTDLSMRLDWNQNRLMIQAWQEDINDPFIAPEPSPDWATPQYKAEDSKSPKPDALAAPETETTILTAQEGVSFLKSLPPSLLGLSGTSMKQYNLYYTEGTAKVDNMVCMRIQVYSLGQASGTNEYLGTYLLATDASHLYRLETNSAAPLEIPLV